MNRLKYLFTLVAISLIIPQGVTAQTERKFTRLALGLNVGYFHPLGGWTAHPYAKGIDLFRGGVAFNGELELVTPGLGVAFNAGYAGLNLGEWKDYAGAAGDHIEASASLFHIGVLLKPHLKTSPRNVVKLEFGLSYSNPNGEERFAGRRFDYDFLKSGLAFTAGLGYDRYLDRATALTFKIGGTFAFPGVKYADGKNHGINGIPISAGIRFDLGDLSRRKKPVIARPVSVPVLGPKKYGEFLVSRPEPSNTVVKNETQAALIVISEVPNLAFESTRRIFETRQLSPNEWQLMVEPDSQIVTIRRSGYLPVKTAALFLQPQRAYRLKVSKVKPISDALLFTTKLQGDSLPVTGAPIAAKTPLEIPTPGLGREKLGELTVSPPEEERVAVVRDENRSVLYVISEVPDLTFESTRQIFETRQRGASEWQLFLEPDSQIVTIQTNGYLPLKTAKIFLQPKRAYRLKVSQVKPAPGTLVIKTQPEGASLRINGVPIDAKTPFGLDEALPRRYKVQVIKEGYRPEEKTLTVESNKMAAWEVKLTQTATRVKIKIKNKKLREVGVTVNGVAKGVAPGEIYLPPGSHLLILQKEGYKQKKKAIKIDSSRIELQLSEKLKKPTSIQNMVLAGTVAGVGVYLGLLIFISSITP